MSEQRHPDPTALAEYRAGLTGGAKGRRLAAHMAACARCADVSEQLAAVSSALASAPAPALPDAVERRIMAALESETSPIHEAPPTPDGASRADRRRFRNRRRGPRSVRRPRLAVLLSAAAGACLVLVGVAYLLGHSAAGPSSSTAAGSAASSPFAGVAHAPAAGNEAVPGPKVAFGTGTAVFRVTASGISYEPASLAAQVRAELAASSAAGTPTVPSAALTGCVLHVTGGVVPKLVDRATYGGQLAYVIAVPGRAWVVGPDCTASNPHVIASTGL